MKVRKGISVFIVIAMIVSLLPAFVACGLKHEYEEFAHIGFTEPYANKAHVLEGKQFALGEHTVYIDDCYSDGKKEDYLVFAEKTFDRMPSPEPLTVYVGEDYSSRTDGGNLYLGTIDPTVFLHTYLQYLGEKTMNYGLLWGVSEHLRAEFECRTPKADDKKAKQYLTEDPLLIDMEAPLFYAPFSDKAEIEKAKTVSFSFIEWLYAKEGEDGLKDLLESDLAVARSPLDKALSSEYNEVFTEKKNAYLRDLGLDLTVEGEARLYRYAPFTVKYPLEIGTEWGRLCIRGDYYAEENQIVHDYCRGSFSLPDYKSLKENLTWLDESAEALLSAFSLELAELPEYIWFLDQDTHFIYNAGGFVDWINQRGNLSNLCEFPHEFTHEIESMLAARDHTYDYQWLTEGLADYAALVLTPKPDFPYESMEKDLQTEGIKALYDKLRPTSDSGLHAWKDAQAVWSVMNGYHLQKDFSFYFRYCSFVYYLVERVGWENFVAFLNAPNTFYAIFGESQYTLWTAWGNELWSRAGEGVAPEDFTNHIC